ncbi:MAG: cold shock domain-containing protein [Bacteroidetes bacterium]|nr:MAG: cold shock domain-containing protein [Bacteroidota bacterium]
MGRSQQTFNKKENEKKKQKKKKDKEKKKEERKMDSDKGKNVEEMYAYVDEHGNITSTPPDPDRKIKEINAEDIEIGVPKKEDVEEETVRNGTVTFFNDSKGYGFIKDHDSQESIFVHINNTLEPVSEGNHVTFETERGPRGMNAIQVKLLK